MKFIQYSVKYLDNIPDDVITELNIPTGAPLVYHLDENLKPIPHKDAIAPLQVDWCLVVLPLLSFSAA